MGSSQSTVAIRDWETTATGERPDIIDKTLKETQNEVSQQKPLITENVIQQLTTKEDSMVLKYSDLQDARQISDHIEKIFKDEYAVQFLTEAAKKMIAVFQDSSEMKKLLRWNQVQKVTKCGSKTVGMELHYKVVITEDKSMLHAKSTVVVLGYKFISHVLDVDPSTIPDDQDLRALTF